MIPKAHFIRTVWSRNILKFIFNLTLKAKITPNCFDEDNVMHKNYVV